MKVAAGFLVGVLAWFIAPFWLQEGMFMDGMIYASVAQNLAQGVGTFWAPIYQPSAAAAYSEQLPLFTGMESLLFMLLGPTPWVERCFMALAWIAAAWGMVALHRKWWPERSTESAIWVVAVWSSAPLIAWGMGNHVQEMWMAPFSLWAVVAMSHRSWAWLGGILTVATALFKGPQGLFPLAWLPILACFGLCSATSFRYQFTQVVLAVLGCAVLLVVWDDAFEALARNASNRLVRTFTQERAVTASNRAWLIGPLFGQLGSMLVAAALGLWLRARRIRFGGDARAYAVLVLGLAASLPLTVTHEQRDFYLITSLGFFAVGLVSLFREMPSERRPRVQQILWLVAVAGLVSLPLRQIQRDEVLRASLEAQASDFPARTPFNVDPSLRLNHELAAYAMRYRLWEVNLANTQQHPNLVVPDSRSNGAVRFVVKSSR